MEVATWWVAATLLALAAVGWWRVAVSPSRTARGVRWCLTVGLAATLTVLGAADGVNAYFGYLPTVSDVAETVVDQHGHVPFADVASSHARHPNGAVVRLDIPDEGSGFGASSALVWLPPQYFSEPAARFPVVFLFHGSPGVPADWFQGGRAAQAGLAAARNGEPAIIVAPRMSHSWLDDPECVDGVKTKVDSHFVLDVVPTVDARMRTRADRDDRVLGGMSAGGYCALQLGLTHRELAAGIVDMSGLTEPTHTGGPAALFGDDPAVVQRRLAETSPAVYAPTLPAAPRTRIWFDVGASDRETRGPITAIAPVLRSRGFEVELHVRPGAHTFHVWAPALMAALPWALAPSVQPTE
ncbi:alpha/beta hydrolase [Jatrophihabitans sp. YIM 134969]